MSETPRSTLPVEGSRIINNFAAVQLPVPVLDVGDSAYVDRDTGVRRDFSVDVDLLHVAVLVQLLLQHEGCDVVSMHLRNAKTSSSF